MEVLVIGAGPAGCQAAAGLARAGHRVTLIDRQAPWEKPCGGGVTAKAARLDDRIVAAVPHERVDRLTIRYGSRASVLCPPPARGAAPLVLSREALGRHLLSEATAAGVRFERDQLHTGRRAGARWELSFRSGTRSADFLVGADGATSRVRRLVAAPLDVRDLNLTQGYFVPAPSSGEMTVWFEPGLEGYLWSFPRPDHISYGIISRPGRGWPRDARALLEGCLIRDHGADAIGRSRFYSAPVPALRPETWALNPIGGPGWALVGDAAGLVDAITGEGIYYALRSAALLLSHFPESHHYQDAVVRECIGELRRASELADRFYNGRFLGGALTERMVRLTARSPALGKVLGELIAGTQGYQGLKRRLIRTIPAVARDLARSCFETSG
jgi:flavin-dependent dehydrogenase